MKVSQYAYIMKNNNELSITCPTSETIYFYVYIFYNAGVKGYRGHPYTLFLETFFRLLRQTSESCITQIIQELQEELEEHWNSLVS